MNQATKKELWKLGFLSGQEIPEEELDVKDLPEDVFKKEKLTRTVYYRVEDSKATPEEVELFLKAKQVGCVDRLRKYALAALVCLVCLTVLAARYLCLG